MNTLRPAVYLDHHASAPLCEAARAAILAGWEAGLGNPSSIHGAGQAARHALDRARREVAAAVGAKPRHVVFTSGATEANHLAVRGIELAAREDTRGEASRSNIVWLSALEHASVHAAVKRRVGADRGGPPWRRGALPVAPSGHLDLGATKSLLDAHFATEPPGASLISVCLVSNELGTIQPVAELATWLRATHPAAILHVDASQALGRVDVDFSAWQLDLLTLSGHKIGAPAGVGALVMRDGLTFEPLLPGHQEEGRRSGTENLCGIIGLGAACADLATRRGELGRIRGLRDSLWDAVRARYPEAVRHGWSGAAPGTRADEPGVVATGADTLAPGVTETGTCLSVAFPGYVATDLVMALDVEGVAVSAGSACSSGLSTPSPVISAILPRRERHLAAATLRFSFGPENQAAELTVVTEALDRVLRRLPRAASRPA